MVYDCFVRLTTKSLLHINRKTFNGMIALEMEPWNFGDDSLCFGSTYYMYKGANELNIVVKVIMFYLLSFYATTFSIEKSQDIIYRTTYANKVHSRTVAKICYGLLGTISVTYKEHRFIRIVK